MAAVLLDINVLMPLVWDKHVHHSAARRWFDSHVGNEWATCPITQCGFVRISSNPKLTDDPITVREAIEALHRTISHPSHVFWEDNLSLDDSQCVAAERLRGHRQVMDAYLVGLCIRRGGRLVTFDQGIMTLARTSEQHRIMVLQP